jgi:recombination protein RecA
MEVPARVSPQKASAEFLGSAWGLEACRGRLAELSGAAATAVLTLALGLVRRAQEAGEPAAWITEPRSTFFPPDAAAAGVDLEALVVVRVPGARLASRAADILVRSGGFGLVIIDGVAVEGSGLVGGRGERAAWLPLAVQTRLAGLATKHRAAVVFLTEKTSEAPSLGPLVSLRLEAARARKAGPQHQHRFALEARVLKDKRRGLGWRHEELCRAPDGLC